MCVHLYPNIRLILDRIFHLATPNSSKRLAFKITCFVILESNSSLPGTCIFISLSRLNFSFLQNKQKKQKHNYQKRNITYMLYI